MNFANGQNMLQNFLTPMILISRMCLSELIWVPHQAPFYTEGPGEGLPGVWTGGRSA
jgi:hypothetical protein